MNGILEQKRLITAKEVAEVLGVKPSTISRWIMEKRIPFIKFGPKQKSIVMFNPQRIKEWIEENSHEPKEVLRKNKREIFKRVTENDF